MSCSATSDQGRRFSASREPKPLARGSIPTISLAASVLNLIIKPSQVSIKPALQFTLSQSIFVLDRVSNFIPTFYLLQQLNTMHTKDDPFFKDMGACIAQTRKERGITQVRLSSSLGIAQQTLAHYEGGKLRLPISLLPALATALDTNVQELIGQPNVKLTTTAKRGPASKLEQQVQQIAQLPRTQQRFVSQMLDTILAQASH